VLSPPSVVFASLGFVVEEPIAQDAAEDAAEDKELNMTYLS
jgi:hypothetical protein